MNSHPEACNPDLLDWIPLTARIVLDVGCGTGALGAAYKRRNPTGLYLGIEANPGAAQIAGTYLDRVAIADVEQNPQPFPIQGGIDCLIYGDVLEHLRDPAAVLRAHMAALSPNGVVLACIPNAEHWSFIARLLDGSWDYEKDGLFDAGHLRWFTRKGAASLLRGAGLTLCDIRARSFDPEPQRQFVQALKPALDNLGIDTADYAARSEPLQYVWRATTAPVQRMTIAARMLDPQGGVSHVRVIHPLEALATDPAVSVHLLAEDEAPPQLPRGTPKILILQRQVHAGAEGREELKRLLDDGWVIVSEFDDHPAFFSVLRVEENYSFTGVHALQTSTEVLRQTFAPINPNLAVFRNMIRELPPVANFAQPDHMTLFFGAFNRLNDWRPCLGALNQAAQAARERLHFLIVNDRVLFDALETPHKRFVPQCDYDTYLDLLGQCEICFMPLQDSDFTRAKSDLKFIEAASCRTVALASPTAYAGTIENGRTGLIFETPDELRTTLMRLLASPESARAIADAARNYVARERMLGHQVAERLAWYRMLWENRAVLNGQLHQRHPELAPTRITIGP